MLRPLSLLTPVVHASVIDSDASKQIKDLRENLYGFKEEALVELIWSIWSLFKVATTLHNILPCIIKLLNRILTTIQVEPGPVGKMKAALSNNLDKRPYENDMFWIAPVLHPATKKLQYLPGYGSGHTHSGQHQRGTDQRHRSNTIC